MREMARRKYSRKRRSRRSRKKNRISLYNSPVPLKTSTKLRYVWTGNINPALGGLASNQIFSANGLFDPDISGTGQQPRGFDQLMALYDHYTVIGAKITVKAFNTDPTHSVQVWVTTRDSNIAYPSPYDNTENGRCSKTVIGPKGSSRDLCTLSAQVNPGKFLSIPSVLSSSNMQGSIAANPTEQVYFHVGAADLNGADDPLPIEMMVNIDYLVVFHEPLQPGQS